MYKEQKQYIWHEFIGDVGWVKHWFLGLFVQKDDFWSNWIVYQYREHIDQVGEIENLLFSETWMHTV